MDNMMDVVIAYDHVNYVLDDGATVVASMGTNTFQLVGKDREQFMRYFKNHDRPKDFSFRMDKSALKTVNTGKDAANKVSGKKGAGKVD